MCVCALSRVEIAPISLFDRSSAHKLYHITYSFGFVVFRSPQLLCVCLCVCIAEATRTENLKVKKNKKREKKASTKYVNEEIRNIHDLSWVCRNYVFNNLEMYICMLYFRLHRYQTQCVCIILIAFYLFFYLSIFGSYYPQRTHTLDQHRTSWAIAIIMVMIWCCWCCIVHRIN